MKKIIIVSAFFCIVWFLFSFNTTTINNDESTSFSSYRLYSNGRHLKNGSYLVYNTTTSPSPYKFLLNDIARFCVATVNPRTNTNSNKAPEIFYYGVDVRYPRDLSIFIGYNPDPTSLAYNTIHVSGSGAYTNFRITMDQSRPWSDFGGSATYSMRSTLIHELGHGVGLDHYDATPDLMNTYPPPLGVSDYGWHQNHREGLVELYVNRATGDSYLNVKSQKNKNSSNRKLSWELNSSGSENFVLGFNIYKKVNGKLITLNEVLIPSNSDDINYSYDVNENNDYYLEIVTEEIKGNKFIKF